MRNINMTHTTETSGAISTLTTRATRVLLLGGVLAGPLYVVTALVQGLTRPGFDLLHHDVSLLSNGNLGWIQIANFLVTGLLVIAGALGMRRVLQGSQGGTWGPFLISIYGLGLIGAGFFTADPMNGFPPGTPAGAQAISAHGLLHLVTGGIGFLALIAACFVFARRFAVLKQSGWSAYSVATGVIFLVSFLGIASGSSQAPIVVGFWIGVILTFAWISIMAARLMPAEPITSSKG
jgi:hypothetical protein